MNRSKLLAFLRDQRWAVQATVNSRRTPQAAVVGVAVTDAFELVFDTVSSTRKAKNLHGNKHIAFVIGWDDAQTVQYEGIAHEPKGEELTALKRVYFARFPDGVERERWPKIAYFRVKPTWIRYSDFRGKQPLVREWKGQTLRALVGGSGALGLPPSGT
jgi:hypothetical protein